MRRLLPEPGDVGLDEILEQLDLADGAPPERPRVVLNMVASVDGRAALEGRTRGLSGEADRALFHGLRERADCVMVGAGTARAEGYGPLIKDPQAPARRQAAGLAPEPVAAVVSRTGAVPLEGALVGDDPRELLGRLRREHAVRSVLCEGGPTLNGHLLRAGLVDELFLTLSPQLLGGEKPLTIVRGGGLVPPRALELIWLLEEKGEVFLRWRLRT